ncbi:MAG: hypothetical protein LBM05_00610 [Endomicrobium sp.]|jgi:hypothetical protein|nr:hypothetical protein [Endomicrobium sp.]
MNKETKKINIKDIEPKYTNILVTANVFDFDVVEGSNVSITSGEIKPYQKILKVGSSIREFQVGDMVLINFDRYKVRLADQEKLINGTTNYKSDPVVGIDIPHYEINNEKVMLIDERDIVFKILDMEEEVVSVPKSTLILPKEKHFHA